MSKTLSLKAEVREQAGSNHAAQIRKAGRIPAVVYGHKQDAVSISLNAHDFLAALHHAGRLLEVEIGGKSQKVLVKDVQYDYLGRDLIHADLIRVDLKELMTVAVALELKGTAEGTHHGGIIEEHVDRLEVECRVTDIPAVIVVLVKDINVGDALHAGEIELPDGVKLVSSPELVVLTCHLVAAAKTADEAEEEEPTAPEVIGEADTSDKSDEESAKE